MQLCLRALVFQSFGEEAAAIATAAATAVTNAATAAGSSCRRQQLRVSYSFSQAHRHSRIGCGRGFGHSFASDLDHHQP